MLVDHEYLKTHQVRSGGRPKTNYELNPKAFQKASDNVVPKVPDLSFVTCDTASSQSLAQDQVVSFL